MILKNKRVSDAFRETSIILKINENSMDIQCPYCLNVRTVNKKRKSKNTLCRSCSKKNITNFFKSENGEYSYFFIKNKESYEKILVDNDIAEILSNEKFGFGLDSESSDNNKYATITGDNIKLHNYIMNHKFSKEENMVVDHINNNNYDNRRKQTKKVFTLLCRERFVCIGRC